MKTILKYAPFVYLVIAVLFVLKGIEQLNSNKGTPVLSFLFAAAAIFMFFFKYRFAKRINGNDQK